MARQAKGTSTVGAPRSVAPVAELAPRVRRRLAYLVPPFVFSLVVLLFSDHAPGIAFSAAKRLWQIGSRVEQAVGVDVIDRNDIPLAFDTLGHVVLWFIAGFLGRLLFSERIRRRTLVVALTSTSLMFEVGQRFLTSGRKVQISDSVANGVGVLGGVMVATALLIVLSWINRLIARPHTLAG